MSISFFLQADEGAEGKVVREYYSVSGEGVRGCGHVEDSIRKAHAKEYGHFVSLLNTQREMLEEVALKAPGERVYPLENVHVPKGLRVEPKPLALVGGKAEIENAMKEAADLPVEDEPAPPAPESVGKLPIEVDELLNGEKAGEE